MSDSDKKIVLDLLKQVKSYKTGSLAKPIGYEILPADLMYLVKRAKELHPKEKSHTNI